MQPRSVLVQTGSMRVSSYDTNTPISKHVFMEAYVAANTKHGNKTTKLITVLQQQADFFPTKNSNHTTQKRLMLRTTGKCNHTMTVHINTSKFGTYPWAHQSNSKALLGTPHPVCVFLSLL